MTSVPAFVAGTSPLTAIIATKSFVHISKFLPISRIKLHKRNEVALGEDGRSETEGVRPLARVPDNC